MTLASVDVQHWSTVINIGSYRDHPRGQPELEGVGGRGGEGRNQGWGGFPSTTSDVRLYFTKTFITQNILTSVKICKVKKRFP